MEGVADLIKIPLVRLFLGIFLTCALIAAGLVFVAVYWRHLLISLETMKLFMLCLGICVPLLLLNMFLAHAAFLRRDADVAAADHERRLGMLALMSSALTMLVLYPTALVGFLFDLHPKTGVIATVVWQLLLAAVMIVARRSRLTLTSQPGSTPQM